MSEVFVTAHCLELLGLLPFSVDRALVILSGSKSRVGSLCCIYIYMCVCVCMYVCVCSLIQACVFAHTYTTSCSPYQKSSSALK